ncbi:MAG: zf-TFIIB domain-containing protein [Phycisphaerales bacterium]|nr:zf-TFIIB domain-containing protein [Phycisphaerales bacterium]
MPRCPSCKLQADPISYEGVRIYHCGGCGGHWMSPERLDVILERREIVMPEPVRDAMWNLAERHNSVGQLWCFSCGTEMTKETFRYWNEIHIDRCGKCDGLWLDRGELELCQIFWEYARDNPDQWQNEDAVARRAELEALLKARRDEVRAGIGTKDAPGLLAFFAGALFSRP